MILFYRSCLFNLCSVTTSTQPYCNWLDWLSLWRSNLYVRSISEWSLYLSPAKSYLDWSCTCFSYSVFSTLVDDPLSPPSSHHSPITPLLLITPSYYIPSLLPSLPLITPSPPHHTSSPHLLTTLFTPPSHHSLKGNHNTKGLVKSHFTMSLNLYRTFLSLKTSFLIIFCKKNFGTKSTKSWNMTAARTCETAHVQRLWFIFPRAIFYPLKIPLFHIFESFLCLNNFSAIFPMYPGTTKATSKKNQVQRCFRFPGILLSEGRRRRIQWHT